MPIIHNLKEREQYQIWRKRNRVRLVDVAKYCGCAISTISQWENNQTNMSDELIEYYNEFIEKFEKGEIAR
ncbi:MAG TPA: hypothetical protein DD791_04930 [Syntrophomonas sp.]|jgi:transcriptional regulator with XRE-family HTH domain|nr:hypothetical protein [Syntrophomonas sp.]